MLEAGQCCNFPVQRGYDVKDEFKRMELGVVHKYKTYLKVC